MSSKKTPPRFRAVGQRSLPSLFSSCSKKSVKAVEEDPDGGSHVPLSERKPHQTAGKPTTVKARLRPFSSIFGLRDLSECIDHDEQIEAKKGGEAEKNHVAALLAFEQFKHTDLGKGHSLGPSTDGGVESSNGDVVEESRKRRNPFEAGVDKHIARKHFTMLGGDSEPSQTRRNESFISKEKPGPVYNYSGGGKHTVRKHFTVLGGDPKPKPQAYQKRRRNESFVIKEKAGPVYNHYANGCGWWDCDREGIDNEEVGLNEVWEGVGSTTLGGIEWH
ncbi:PREDICTED: LOC110689226 isoform [Prunus dulcis]|uniref:PREDICTED: LOC110689226 isoform n=1 Tax=Prunus dulcis TaxID=3755 RepID=A0A5E4FFN7_PRUDU|nr:uncharacterized protein LOC117615395 [Prunus dulcis]KAI5347596.1 hypothetical protein L3X38_000483 [Prunus dulcis]VVA26190.1 PREDICTED: LOC110689226 isoform [Prunus dulcis]